jgi:hypothetical protein
MTSLSQIIKNGQTLQAPAGPLAINQNDLVVLAGSPPQLYSAQVLDYVAAVTAGAAVVASTTYSSNGAGSAVHRNQVAVNPADGSIFILDSYQATLAGQTVWRYSQSGALVGSVVLDSNASSLTSSQIVQLAGGNFACFWAYANAGLYYAIIDANLNIIVPKTFIATVGSNPGPVPFLLALVGGGFAITYTVAGSPGGLYLVIYRADGSQVSGPTSIPGMAPQNSASNAGIGTRMAQLSNGNIAIAILDGGTKIMGYVIYSVVGAAVVAYTALTGATASQGSGYPEISVLPNGYFCVSVGTGNPTTVAAYVMNNAGQLQGAPFTLVGGNQQGRLINDGTNFWLFYYTGSSTACVKIPVTGTNMVSTTLPVTGLQDAIYERGMFIVTNGSLASVFAVTQMGTLVLIGTAAFASTVQSKAGIGDFCIIGLTGGKFNITKYLSATIFGLASTAVAAGNAGQLVQFNPGPGSYPSNPLSGSPAKAFDHSAAVVIGNKGTLFNNAVALKGF